MASASARGQVTYQRCENEASVADEPFETDVAPGVEIDSGRDVLGNDIQGATPPGYDWPTHGGYLGCLLAVMFACLLAPLGYIVVGFIGALLYPKLGGLGVGLAIALTVIGYVATFVALSRLGWRLGKRFFRAYPQPAGPGWGEADDETDVAPELASQDIVRDATDDTTASL